VTSLLPPGLGLTLIRRLPWRIVDGRREEARREPCSPAPWWVFPDGVLHGVAFEMLEDSEPGLAFGQDRAVNLCLRSRPSAACSRTVDFARGWLGLGGVPPAGSLPPLPKSGKEVRQIQNFLQERGHPAGCLTGPEAHAEALRSHLVSLRPAILHFAVHGLADLEHPEACALVLADCPQSYERELLPFRRIRELDLQGVDLVILAACRSLRGPSSRSAGMEGLAWAFLQAGAAQVVASRRRVNDQATSQLMSMFYRHLQGFPVAEALGRTRGEWLSSSHLNRKHIEPWSVWT
jgi:CHAT domain-containing protein